MDHKESAQIEEALVHQSGKPTLVMGTSLKDWRISYMAVRMLRQAGYEVFCFGAEEGFVHGVPVRNEIAKLKTPGLHTVTLYMNAGVQAIFHDFILQTNPQRLIFNPGAENPDLQRLAHDAGIQCVNACTLVMLSQGQF